MKIVQIMPMDKDSIHICNVFSNSEIIGLALIENALGEQELKFIKIKGAAGKPEIYVDGYEND